MKPLRISCIPKSKGYFWAVLVLLTLCAGAAGIFAGSVRIPAAEVFRALTGQDTTSVYARIVLYTRLPRVCGALLAGAAMAAAGAIIQTALDNPLASPGVIGVNSGAGLAVAILCAVAPSAQRWAPAAAFLGALVSALLVMGLAFFAGASKMTVVLAGVALSNLFSALIDGVVTVAPDALMGVTDFRIGGFSGVSIQRLIPAAAAIGCGLIPGFFMTREMDILALGGDVAQSLGLPVTKVRLLLLLLAAMLTGAAVSFAGLLGFVGLIVPHAMRRFVGQEHGRLLAASALGGGFFALVCDLLARVVFAPYEIPVGIVLSVAGCPFFLWLLLRRKGRNHD